MDRIKLIFMFCDVLMNNSSKFHKTSRIIVLWIILVCEVRLKFIIILSWWVISSNKKQMLCFYYLFPWYPDPHSLTLVGSVVDSNLIFNSLRNLSSVILCHVSYCRMLRKLLKCLRCLKHHNILVLFSKCFVIFIFLKWGSRQV